jgi:type III secretion protein C
MKYWLFVFCYYVLSAQALAATPDSWKETSFSYQEEPRHMGHFLKVFSQAMGVRTQVSYPGLQDKPVSGGQQLSGNPAQVLDRLAGVYSFQWYVYRNTLYISDYPSDRIEHITLKGVSPTQAKQALTAAGLFEPKFGWAEFDRGSRSAVMVSGPPSYLALVNGLLNRISTDDPDKEERRVMVFPLRFASATDNEIPTREGSSIRLGVASTLKKLLSPNRGTNIDNSSEFPKGGGLRMSKSLGSITSVSASTPSFTNSMPSVSNPFGGTNPLGPFNTDTKEEEEPVIEAYAPLNAVIIRDKPSKKPIYEQIFKTLDVPARRVELVVTIVDVDVSTLDEWIPQISIGGSKNKISIQTPGGVDVASAGNVVLVSTNGFAVALKNSESTGQARIQSRPSVMTLDNLSAILDLSQTAYFKLIGERTADVKSVTVGTRLKVIPRVLGYSSNADLHVQIELEDGSLQALNDDGELTQSRSSLIATQAVISPGQSLLIGGYRRDADEKNRSRIPFLSGIPKIGELFKSETSRSHRVERLFVLSARVVPDPVPAIPAQVKQLEQELILP